MRSSVYDFNVISSAIQRTMPDVEAVEPQYQGDNVCPILKREREDTPIRYLIGHAERDDQGTMIPGTIHLIPPAGNDDN